MITHGCIEQLELFDIKELANAGQKIVYQAKSYIFGDVVVKIIKQNQDIERIFREIEIVNKLEVESAQIFKYDTLKCNNGDEYLYIIESFIEGINLREYLNQIKIVDYKEVCSFLLTIVNIIAILEKNHIVHRDIKPENIMRTKKGNYILIDYGIARDLSKESLTATSSPQGPATVIYAPIEQIDNQKELIDSRADLYAVSLVAYEMLSGINPYIQDCENVLQVMRKVDKGDFTYLENQEYQELLDFIHTNMNRHRTRRVSSAKEAKNWVNEIYKKLCTRID